MSTPDPNSESEPADVPSPIRLAPGRNQKQRSKLKQADDPTVAEEPESAAPPAPPKPVPEPVRRTKLKRSGQMHADLTGPIPPDPHKDEPEY